MNALEKLVHRANEMDMTEQDQYLGDVFMPPLARKELERLQAVEAAAREVMNAFMVTDVWDDEAGTPAREEAIGDMTRDQKLEALAAALEAKP